MIANKQARVFAHRGSNRLAPENSQAAFELALFQGVSGFECDIQLSKDGVPILWHDDGMDRIGLPGKRVDLLTWDELQLLDISFLAHGYGKFCGLFSLQELLDRYACCVSLLLEIKKVEEEEEEHHLYKVKKTINLLEDQKRQNCSHSFLVSSFDYETLKYAHSLNEKIDFIANSETASNAKDIQEIHQDMPFLAGICLEVSCVNEETVKAAHKLNLLTLCYTCNDSETYKRMTKCGIDIVISDTPSEL